MQQTPESYRINLKVVGDCEVGKSNFILRYSSNIYSEISIQYLPGEYTICHQKIDGEEVEFNIFDTDQNERNQQQLFRQNAPDFSFVDAFLIVCDLTNRDYFENLSNWIKTLSRNDKPFFLIGAKSDCINDLEVTSKEFKAYAEKISGCIGSQCVSAKSDTNIKQSFEEIGRALLPAVKKKFGEKNKPNLDSLKQKLENYTSLSNKVSAYAKNIFSFGIFSLGLKKQKLAEKLKKELIKDQNISISKVNEYINKNSALVEKEFDLSCLFAKNYIPKGDGQLKKGELGKILENFSPQKNTKKQ